MIDSSIRGYPESFANGFGMAENKTAVVHRRNVAATLQKPVQPPRYCGNGKNIRRRALMFGEGGNSLEIRNWEKKVGGGAEDTSGAIPQERYLRSGAGIEYKKKETGPSSSPNQK